MIGISAGTSRVGGALSALRHAAAGIEDAMLAPIGDPYTQRVEKLVQESSCWSPACLRCGGVIHETEVATPEGCGRCVSRRLAWSRCVRLGTYDNELRLMIHQFKFERWIWLGERLGAMFGERLRAALDEAGVEARDARIVPVATSFRRRMERNLDHTLVLSRAASRASGVPVLGLLTKRHRPSQLSVPVSERRANVRQAFRCRPFESRRFRVLVLLDDVMTSGATMSAACRTVREAATGDCPMLWAGVLAVPVAGNDARNR